MIHCVALYGLENQQLPKQQRKEVLSNGDEIFKMSCSNFQKKESDNEEIKEIIEMD